MNALDQAMLPWDGVRRMKKPAGYVPGLYRLHQLDAEYLLRSGATWFTWAANILQAIAYQDGPLSPAQEHYLRQFTNEVKGRVSA
jgi:hypothetical protein